MESVHERQQRLNAAQEKAIARHSAPTGLVPGNIPEIAPDEFPGANVVDIQPSPIESACYDALMYLHEGMTGADVLQAVMLRNRIKLSDAEKIIEQARLKIERDKQ